MSAIEMVVEQAARSSGWGKSCRLEASTLRDGWTESIRQAGILEWRIFFLQSRLCHFSG